MRSVAHEVTWRWSVWRWRVALRAEAAAYVGWWWRWQQWAYVKVGVGCGGADYLERRPKCLEQFVRAANPYLGSQRHVNREVQHLFIMVVVFIVCLLV